MIIKVNLNFINIRIIRFFVVNPTMVRFFLFGPEKPVNCSDRLPKDESSVFGNRVFWISFLRFFLFLEPLDHPYGIAGGMVHSLLMTGSSDTVLLAIFSGK